MAGGKGKSTGGKAGPKEAAAKSQKSHSAKAGLQVRKLPFTALRSAHVDRRVNTRMQEQWSGLISGQRLLETLFQNTQRAFSM